MTVAQIPLKGSDGVTKSVDVIDTSGTGVGPYVALHGATDSSGSPINPAQDASVTAVTTALGSDGSFPPALPGGSTGVRGWLRYLASLVGAQALDATAALTNTALASVLTKLASVNLGAGSAVVGKVGLQVGGSDLDAAHPLPVIGKATLQLNAPTITCSTSTYSANMVVGGALALSGAPTSGTIQGAFANVKSPQTAGLELYVFKSNPTTSAFADHVAAALAAADVPSLIGVIPVVEAYSSLNTAAHTLYQADRVGKSYASGSGTLYVVPVIKGAATFGTTADWVNLSLLVQPDL